MTPACATDAELDGYRTGSAPAPLRARVEEHVAGCEDCRLALEVSALLGQGAAAGEEDALRALARDDARARADLDVAAARTTVPGALGPVAAASPPGSAVRARLREPRAFVRRLSRARPARLAAGAAACAALALAVLVRPRPPEREGGGPRERPLELALAGAEPAPYAPHRGARGEGDFTPALRRLLEAQERGASGAERALAALYVERQGEGDLARAEELLAPLAPSPDADTDRAALAAARGDPLRALDFSLRALGADPAHPAARFNRAVSLERLGLPEAAREAFDALARAGGPWAGEARDRSAALAARVHAAPAATRREVQLALLLAGGAEEVARAAARARLLEPEQSADLLALADWLSRLGPARLAVHAALARELRQLRERAVGEGLDPARLSELLERPGVADDLLVWPAAVQLLGYVSHVKSAWRTADRLDAQLRARCAGGLRCAAEYEAIALDELAESAARDGDAREADRLQQGAERIFLRLGAWLQLAELDRKRAAFLAEQGRSLEAGNKVASALARIAADGSQDARLVRAMLASSLADLAARRGLVLAALEARGAGAAIARAIGARDLEANLGASVLLDEVAAGRPVPPERLEQELQTQRTLGHQAGVQALELQLAKDELERRDLAAARAHLEAALAAAGEGWTSELLELHGLHARVLEQLGREEEALRELQRARVELVQEIVASPDGATRWSLAGRAQPLALAEAILRARAGGAAADVIDVAQASWAATVLRPRPASGWRARLGGRCVLAVLSGAPRDPRVAVAVQGAGAGAWQLLPDPGELDGTVARVAHAQCSPAGEVWVIGAPELQERLIERLEREGFAAGAATSVEGVLVDGPVRTRRVVVLQPPDAKRALPETVRDLAALQRLAPALLVHLSGDRATLAGLAAAVERADLAHFATHGLPDGESTSLLLAGEPARLSSAEVEALPLGARPLVVLSACEAQQKISFAFLRAGARAVVAARGDLRDAAAAAWAERFYARIAAGDSIVQANHAAGGATHVVRQ